jgi:hypothetical protein
MKEAVTRLDYCQYLLASQINYTLINFADHSELMLNATGLWNFYLDAA